MSARNNFEKFTSIFVARNSPPDNGQLGPQPRGASAAARSVIAQQNVVAAAAATAPAIAVDFSAIYGNAAVPSALVKAEDALYLIASVPSNIGPEARKHMAVAMVNTFTSRMGAKPEDVVNDATAKIEALEAHITTTSTQARDFAARTEGEIAGLQQQIEQKRQAVLASKQQQAGAVQCCRNESQRLSAILSYLNP